jgi:hypothetical protein
VDRPSTRTCPDVGNNIPLVNFKAVLLPDPLRPSKTKVSPASTERFTWDKIFLPEIS